MDSQETLKNLIRLFYRCTMDLLLIPNEFLKIYYGFTKDLVWTYNGFANDLLRIPKEFQMIY